MRPLAVAAMLCAIAAPARADDDFAGATVIFARGTQLLRIDPRGKTETELATFGEAPDKDLKKAAKHPKPPTVRSLTTDGAGKVLLVDLDGSWQWMPLDGSAKTLTALPCADGPAQLGEDGTCVLCRSKVGSSMIVNLASNKTFPVDVPGARVVGTGADRKLVWADKDGVWSAPAGDRPKAKTTKKVAPQAPLRGFLPSPDGSRALGVFTDEVYTDAHHKTPAAVLMGFALDGEGARRKSIQAGVPLEWSHDSQWVLVQDGANACLVHATGGEYKCWKGFTAASISSDGRFGLFLGNRDGSHRQTPAEKPGKGKAKPKPEPAKKPPAPKPDAPVETEAESGEGGEIEPADVAVPPPSGPLSLFRAKLEGSAFTESPALVAKIVDGAAVWVPGTP